VAEAHSLAGIEELAGFQAQSRFADIEGACQAATDDFA